MFKFILSVLLRRQVASLMFFSGLCLFGLLSLREIPLSLLPNIEFPKLTIITSYPNSSPGEIENLISKPISQVVGTIQGVEKVESISKEGYSFVHLRFKNGTDMNFALLEAREKLDLIRDQLPYDSSKSIITRFDPSSSAFMEIVLSSRALGDPKKLRQWIEDKIKLYYERIDGIALVQVVGGFEKEILIEIDPSRLNSYQVQPIELSQLISSNNKNYPAGQLPFGKKDLPVRAIGEFKTSFDLENLVVRGADTGRGVKLSDFSSIYERYKERTGIARYNGNESVILYLYKEPGKNTVSLANEVKNVTNNVNDLFKNEINAVISFDESIFIVESINGLYANLIIGAILAYVSLLLILKNFQSPTLLLLAIPVTLLPSFLVFYEMGIGFNMMSLGGLALGVGMLFDSSNVVISAIERNLSLGKNLVDSIIEGTEEVVGSVVSATSTTIIVFLPIAFIKSTLGIIFREMAFAIVITLSFSLIIALTFIPLLASLLYRKRKFDSNFISKFSFYDEDKITKIYHKGLRKVLEAPKYYLLLLLSLFAFSLSLLPYIEKEFIPRIDTGEIIIHIKMPQGTGLEALDEYVKYVESIIKADPTVKSYLSNVGGEEENLKSNPNAITNSNEAELRVLLVDNRVRSTIEIVNDLKSKISISNEIQVDFKTKENILGDILAEKKEVIEYQILGEDIELMDSSAKALTKKLEKLPGVEWVRSGLEEKGIEYNLEFDQLKMAKYGLSYTNVSSFVKIALKGIAVSKMDNKDLAIPLRIGMQKANVNSEEKLGRLRIQTPYGENISLNQFLTFSKSDNLTSIHRNGNLRVNAITVGINPIYKNLKREIQSTIDAFPRSEEIKIEAAGEKAKLDESLKDVTLSFFLALLLIFMLLAGQFESYRSSLIILISIPLIFIGTFPALFMSSKSLNVSSFMGFILLMGVVVDNASLFYEYFHLFLKQFNDPEAALFQATQVVIRPIIMNNTTTILGMLPIVFTLGKGSEFQAPLGVVVISGLLTSVILSLFVIPSIVYFQHQKVR
ncbi:efflux RND transporter permease subunit [Leptospira paudalimensis]|uniref:Efflux RND transporter permease subunit n=1 Tax=Leptospira paudalimensis TaxID=2950024 RepID=A0ABT3MCM9_9LEPT|nr:efflux RND transporter permease subunit [Leptospira paudalimensis]MCW7506144.1 efflux RND transporter permease subunit [Leptospira paudalimensis]